MEAVRCARVHRGQRAANTREVASAVGQRREQCDSDSNNGLGVLIARGLAMESVTVNWGVICIQSSGGEVT